MTPGVTDVKSDVQEVSTDNRRCNQGHHIWQVAFHDRGVVDHMCLIVAFRCHCKQARPIQSLSHLGRSLTVFLHYIVHPLERALPRHRSPPPHTNPAHPYTTHKRNHAVFLC